MKIINRLEFSFNNKLQNLFYEENVKGWKISWWSLKATSI